MSSLIVSIVILFLGTLFEPLPEVRMICVGSVITKLNVMSCRPYAFLDCERSREFLWFKKLKFSKATSLANLIKFYWFLQCYKLSYHIMHSFQCSQVIECCYLFDCCFEQIKGFCHDLTKVHPLMVVIPCLTGSFNWQLIKEVSITVYQHFNNLMFLASHIYVVDEMHTETV